MRLATTKKILPLALMMAFSTAGFAFASELDHHEFEATLHAPYKGDANAAADQKDARVFELAFNHPHVKAAQDVVWRLELADPDGQVVERWAGTERLFQKEVKVKVRWSGSSDTAPLADGLYQVRMRAVSIDAGEDKRGKLDEDAIDALLAERGDEVIQQEWEISVGQQSPVEMPAFAPMETMAPLSQQSGDGAPYVVAKAPAIASLPYTVYFANLHSQTNHSDGGSAIGSCTGAKEPLTAPYGPSDAFAYAKSKGLDILMTSEHNHMYDGSSATRTTADPATAKALYQSGRTTAANFSTANPNFLAVYGLEWGVITNGGHLNIFNSPELLQWEYNSSGQLIGDTYTPKGDYAGLYTLMRQRGWVGQFNHPETTGQFLVNGVPLGYTADGDQAMVLCEVLNTSAFSNNTTETETGRTSFEAGCKKALEAGFHVAFSTNQDNHCANWGASYTNRTAVLIPSGTALTMSSFITALKARRVFATMDKNSQLVLTANGRIMGERFINSGPLNLVVNFANTAGKTVSSVVIYQGVPRRNGTVTQLATVANTTITPSVGEHFYYAKVTQSDGKILWSAPIWVTQN